MPATNAWPAWRRCATAPVILYSVDAQAASLTAHQCRRRQGGADPPDRVALANGTSESFLPGLGRLTVARATHAGVSLEEPAGQPAAAWALGIPPNLDRRGRRGPSRPTCRRHWPQA